MQWQPSSYVKCIYLFHVPILLLLLLLLLNSLFLGWKYFSFIYVSARDYSRSNRFLFPHKSIWQKDQVSKIYFRNTWYFQDRKNQFRLFRRTNVLPFCLFYSILFLFKAIHIFLIKYSPFDKISFRRHKEKPILKSESCIIGPDVSIELLEGINNISKIRYKLSEPLPYQHVDTLLLEAENSKISSAKANLKLEAGQTEGELNIKRPIFEGNYTIKYLIHDSDSYSGFYHFFNKPREMLRATIVGRYMMF